MSYLKFEVKEDRWVTYEGDPNDRWDRDSTDANITVLGCKVVPEDGWDILQAAFDVRVGDKVYLVWAQYSTGDSFGSDGGQYELCKVCDKKVEAEQEANRLKDVKSLAAPWNGYFERLDFIRVEEFEVKE